MFRRALPAILAAALFVALGGASAQNSEGVPYFRFGGGSGQFSQPPGPLTIVADLPQGQVGHAYQAAPSAAGGTGPYNFQINTALPPGLSFDPSSGSITGIPSAEAVVPGVSFTVTDIRGHVASTPGRLLVITNAAPPAPLTISLNIPAGLVGHGYSATPTIGGGNAPFSFSINAALPSGLSFSPANGAITGTPNVAATVSSVIVTVTDAYGYTAASSPQNLSIQDETVYPPLSVSGVPASWGTAGTAYSASFSAAGGDGSYTYQLYGSRPAWMNFDTSTGQVSGTPSAAGSVGPLSVIVTDGQGSTASSSPWTIDVAAPLALSQSLPAGVTASAYSGGFSATGGTGPLSYALSGTLPADLSFSTSNGQISGTISTGASTGNYPLSATVVDARGRTANSSGTLVVNAAPIVYSYSTATGMVGQAVTASPSISGGRTPYSFGVTAGTLPAGLSLNPATGVVSGVPSEPGSTTVTVSVIDYVGQQKDASLNFSIAPLPLVVSGTPQTFAMVGEAYSASFSATGGYMPRSFALSGGAAPAGLTLDSSTGVLSGVPTQAGNFGPYTVVVTDGASNTANSDAFSINVAATLQVASSLPDVMVGDVYNGSFQASGGTAPLSYALTGDLPAGLSFNTSTGAITGTVSASADVRSYPLSATVTDAHGRTASASGTLTTTITPVTIAYSGNVDATTGAALSTSPTVSGGRTPYSFQVVSGTLPDGVSINASNGTVAGIPTTTGDTTLTIRATDAIAQTADATLTISVKAPVAVAISMPTGVDGRPYAGQATASGGDGAFTYAIASGVLPSGLTLNTSTGSVTGSAAAGSYNVAFRATDSVGRTGTSSSANFQIGAALSVSGTPAQVGTVGALYTATFNGLGGKAPYSYALVGTPPDGVSMNASTGVLSGTPTTGGTATGLSVTVTDADNYTASTPSFSIAVDAPIVVTANAPGGGVGAPYTASFSADGGVAPYTWSVSGALPSGLTLNSSTGTVSGTPQPGSGGSYPLTVTATDNTGRVGWANVTIAIDQPMSLSLSGSWPDTSAITAGTPVPTTVPAFSVAGGVAPYTFDVSAGAVPAGTSLQSSATTTKLVGNYTTAGTYGFTVRVTDATSHTATLASPTFTIYANPGTNYATNPYLYVGDAYTVAPNTAGGRAPYSYAIASGALPAGVTLNASTGVISGSPNAGTAGTYTATVRVTDVDGRSSIANLPTLTVLDALTLTFDGSWPAGGSLTLNQPYASPHFIAAGGQGPYTFTVSSGSPVPGMTISGGADFRYTSGTPNTSGSYAGFTIQVADNLGHIASLSTPALVVYGAPAVVYTATPATTGVAYSVTPTVTDGHAPYGFAISGGTLPNGLVLNSATGVVSGTPDTAGSSTVTITATDADGRTGSGSATIAVTAPIVVSGSAGTSKTGQSFSATFSATGGAGSPYTFTLSGSLPTGLNFDAPTATISGTANYGTAGNYPVSIAATDAAGRSGSLPVTLVVQEGLRLTMSGSWTTANTTGVVNSPYSGSPIFNATGGQSPYSFQVSSGALPNGLSFAIQSNGTSAAITGTPTQSGSFAAATLQVTDNAGATATLAANAMTIYPVLTLSGSPGNAATVGQLYSSSFSATGGHGPYTYSAGSQPLPSWLSINSSTGALTGTPTMAAIGTSTMTVKATDSDGRQVESPAFSVTVSNPIVVSGPSTTSANVGTLYSSTLAASGGQSPYNYTIDSGTLPSWLTLNASTGVLSGTPTTTGTVGPFTVKATDANSYFNTSSPFSITVAPSLNPLTISATSPPATATVNGPYSTTFFASGGTTPYVWSLAPGSGALPPGISLASNGVLSGTPTATGSYTNIVVRVSDAAGAHVDRAAFNITVGSYLTVTAAPADTAIVGTGYSASFSPAGGVAPYTMSLAPGSGSLPPGTILQNVSMAMVGTPNTAGLYSGIIVRITDSAGRTGDYGPFSVNVLPKEDPSTGTLSVAFRAGYKSSTLRQAGTTYTIANVDVGADQPNHYAIFSIVGRSPYDSTASKFVGSPSVFVNGVRATLIALSRTNTVAPTFVGFYRAPIVNASTATLDITYNETTTGIGVTSWSAYTGGGAPSVIAIGGGASINASAQTLAGGYLFAMSWSADNSQPTFVTPSQAIHANITTSGANGNNDALQHTLGGASTPSTSYGVNFSSSGNLAAGMWVSIR